MTKSKPHNIAYTTLHNWLIGFADPEFRWPLKGHAIERVIAGLDNWELNERHDLKRLDNCVLMMANIYTIAKSRNTHNIEWLPRLRERFIKKCLDYFNRRIQELRDDIEVTTKKDQRRVNVSKSHIKKYEERIKIYTLWLRQENAQFASAQ